VVSYLQGFVSNNFRNYTKKYNHGISPTASVKETKYTTGTAFSKHQGYYTKANNYSFSISLPLYQHSFSIAALSAPLALCTSTDYKTLNYYLLLPTAERFRMALYSPTGF
jgi:hypothetical protein